MAAITYGAGAPAATAKAAAKPAATKSFFARMWDAMIEARMRQAMREVALHRHLLPAELEQAGRKLTDKVNP